MIFPIMTEQEMEQADNLTLRERVRELSLANGWLKSITEALGRESTREDGRHSVIVSELRTIHDRLRAIEENTKKKKPTKRKTKRRR